MTAAGDLAKIQSAVAALVMEPGRIEEFRSDPAAYARRFGLRGKGAGLLAGLDLDGAAYFARRRTIDRFHYLKGDLPRSAEALDTSAYFAARPYAKEDPREEAKQLRAWARKAPIPAPLRDLVEMEVAGFLLLDRAHDRKRPAVQLLVLRHDPDGLLADPLAAAPGRFPVALLREPDDVELYRLEPVAEGILKGASGLEKRFGAKAVQASRKDLRKLGLLKR